MSNGNFCPDPDDTARPDTDWLRELRRDAVKDLLPSVIGIVVFAAIATTLELTTTWPWLIIGLIAVFGFWASISVDWLIRRWSGQEDEREDASGGES